MVNGLDVFYGLFNLSTSIIRGKAGGATALGAPQDRGPHNRNKKDKKLRGKQILVFFLTVFFRIFTDSTCTNIIIFLVYLKQYIHICSLQSVKHWYIRKPWLQVNLNLTVGNTVVVKKCPLVVYS